MLNQSLARQRQHASQLAQALARNEDTQTALRMALDCALRKAESVSALLRLSESEELLLLAPGGNVSVINGSEEAFEDRQASLLWQAVNARKQAEIEAQRLDLGRLDNSCRL